MNFAVKRVLLSGLTAAAMASVLTTVPASASEAPAVQKPGNSASLVVSPYSYEYDYSLGFSLILDPASVMTAADTTFKSTFPFASDCGAWSDLPPVTDPPVRCDLFFLGTTNPVSVVDRTATSFTLKSLPGHSEGADRFIRFTFYQQPATFALRMKVEGWGPWTLAAQASVDSGAVNKFWTDYAANLKNRLQLW
ncbi:hypothetical protein [Streptomyces sp. NPDC058701]|uniref:hypothetical protein n=1 Tax=Streptomyces sp. NPDC058701 TaxID=3346608 RepID=UPI00364F4A22